jgi:hypothetical protein
MYEEIHFPGQLSDETVLLLLRRHWFVLFTRLIFVIIATITLVIVYFLFRDLNTNLQESAFHNLLIFGESIATLFIWNFFFILWIDYYLDVWIVTNERIINIEQKGFFNRNISELKLIKIQDVTSEINGFIPTVLNYGNICVQTAGEVERFTFQQIPNPNHVKNVIVQLQEKANIEEDREMGKAVRGEI